MEERTTESSERVRNVLTDEQIREIDRIAGTIRYGSISLVFQDGVLVQIERHEKIRMR